MLKIAIVDDDRKMLEQIEFIIKDYVDDITIDLYNDSLSFFKIANDHYYDIIFLDIQMPQMNGFELASSLREIKYEATIVFISGFEHLVWETFKFKPFGFVRKEKLKSDIADIFDRTQKNSVNEETFTIKTTGSVFTVKISKIAYFECMSHDIYVLVHGEKFKIKRNREKSITMKSLSVQFENKGFIRVHKSYLVNYKYIHFIDQYKVVLKNNEEIAVNPRNIPEIKKAYQNFMMNEGE